MDKETLLKANGIYEAIMELEKKLEVINMPVFVNYFKIEFDKLDTIKIFNKEIAEKIRLAIRDELMAELERLKKEFEAIGKD